MQILTPTPRYTEAALDKVLMTAVTATGFSIHDGRADIWDPYLRRWEGGRDGADTVYGIVEIASGPATEVAGVVWDAVDAALAEQRLSITRLFNQALTNTHESLSDYAARGWTAGVTLAAMRGDEIYVAWAGPSLALFTSETGELLRPSQGGDDSDLLDIPLGAKGKLTPRLVRRPVAPGFELVLSWTSLSERVNDRALEALLTAGSDGSAQAIYRLVNDEREFAALVARFGPQGE